MLAKRLEWQQAGWSLSRTETPMLVEVISDRQSADPTVPRDLDLVTIC